MTSGTTLDARSGAPSSTELLQALRVAQPRNGYLAYHAPRYALLLRILDAYIRPQFRVLDIGRSHLTQLIAGRYGVQVDSLGFDPDGTFATGRHYQFDLNESQSPDNWRTDVSDYDTVVMAEVIEHLHTSPTRVLACVRRMVKDGGILILQTPNAVALHKRLKMIVGRNPYELIREDITDPGHFREYTRRELVEYASSAGFTVEQTVMGSYFDYRYIRHSHTTLTKRSYLNVVNYAYKCLPAGVQPGITLVLRAS